MIYFIFILCSLIYRPRHQVTSQNVIWTTRVIDLSVLLIFILILFFVTICIRIYCFCHKHFSSAIRLLFYCLRYQIRSDTIFATSSLQFTIFSVYSSGVTWVNIEQQWGPSRHSASAAWENCLPSGITIILTLLFVLTLFFS